MGFEKGKLYQIVAFESEYEPGIQLVKMVGPLLEPVIDNELAIDIKQIRTLTQGDVFMFLQTERYRQYRKSTNDNEVLEFLVVLFEESIWTTDYQVKHLLDVSTIEKVS